MKKILTALLLIASSVAVAQKITLTTTEVNAGQDWTLRVTLQSVASYSAIQMNLSLPEGLTVGQATNGALMTSNHQIVSGTLDNGTVNVICYAPNSTVFSASSGTLLTLPLHAETPLASGTYTISVSDIRLSDGTGSENTLADKSVTLTSSTAAPTNYTLTYYVDGQVYKTYTVAEGSTITQKPETPTREGYTFSGWSTIPSVMPSQNVEVTGTFSVNYYNVIYKADGKVVSKTSVAYGSPMPAAPDYKPVSDSRYTRILTGWEGETYSSMPAHDVTYTAIINVVDGVQSVVADRDEAMYDLAGRRLNTLPRRGIYVRNGRKVIVR